ncbi:DsbA family oxidoreductase [Pontibacter sp. MBLB2868]|uniref:DsbA family oxidoreductase n=1 Tax=Pontibacter sp. MBLB2868 TaxID=3451555 RepID=UPI003F74E09F
MNKQKIKIDIVSDINCPWCYIGEQRLKKAMDAVENTYDFDISFKAFELNASVPENGWTRKEYFLKNYGESILPKLGEMDKQMTSNGAEEGIEFNFTPDMRVNNTFNGHRLIWLAGECGVQEAVANALFKSYFTDNKNMNDTDILKAIGVENGIPAERLEGFFEGDEGRKEVREMESFAQAAGITGVPAFIINDQYLVNGAQPSEAFLNAFKQIAPALQEIKSEGGSCDIDAGC